MPLKAALAVPRCSPFSTVGLTPRTPSLRPTGSLCCPWTPTPGSAGCTCTAWCSSWSTTRACPLRAKGTGWGGDGEGGRPRSPHSPQPRKTDDPSLAFPVTHPHILRWDWAERDSGLCFAPKLGASRSDLGPHHSSSPIPKHLHTPGSNGRYSTVQCRISHSSLTSLLRDWSSFVLVEGYSYVKLLSRCAK